MNGSALMGHSTRLLTIQSEFYTQVAQRYGLQRQASKKRLSGPMKREVAAAAFDTILENPDLLKDPGVRQALIETLSKNPELLLLALGLDIPNPKTKRKTFVEVMTKPVKPEKPIEFSGMRLNSDLFHREGTAIFSSENSVFSPQKDIKVKPGPFSDIETGTQLQTLSCVCFAQPTTSDAVEGEARPDVVETSCGGTLAKAVLSTSLDTIKLLTETQRNEHQPDAGISIVSSVIKNGNYHYCVGSIWKAQQVFTLVGTATKSHPLRAEFLRMPSPCSSSGRGPPGK